jgi:hypothetical protein
MDDLSGASTSEFTASRAYCRWRRKRLPRQRRATASRMSADDRSQHVSLTIGWQAMRANLKPALALQAVMLVVVLAYYFSARFAALLAAVAEYKLAHGIPFVVLSAIVAAALLPELFLVIFAQGGRFHRDNFRNLLFTVPLWGFGGITVDLLYRGLAWLLGDDVTLPVIIAKICIDQFIYSVFFAAPYEVIAYEWKNSGFSAATLRRCFSLRYYREKIFPTILTNWFIWIPLVAMIYSLPLPLQFPLFSFALTFWVLLLTYMTNVFAGKEMPQVALTPQIGEAAR